MSEPLAIEMSLKEWLYIDAVMDNVGALSRHNFGDGLYNPQRAARADTLRAIGWDATGPITRPISDAGLWPPSDDVTSTSVTVSLAVVDWGFGAPG